MEYHVAVTGNDRFCGSSGEPFRTISKAAETARSGDTVTVHEGVYREWVKPAHGGRSDSERITYQAAPGEHVVIKGSEEIKDWERFREMYGGQKFRPAFSERRIRLRRACGATG